MNARYLCAAAAAILVGGSVAAVGQSQFKPLPDAERYMPRLSAIMSGAQNQHLKLWFAGKEKNWELAAYELRHLTDSLAEAAVLYENIPVSNVTTMKDPLLSIADAVMAGNSSAFLAAMNKLTDGCNACHSAMNRKYIVMTLPRNQPPSNQVFERPGANKK